MNRTCLTILVLLASVAIAAHAHQKFPLAEISEEEASDMLMCLGTIVCEANEARQLQRIHDKAGPRLQVNAREWLADVYEIPTAKEEGFWDRYPNYVCIRNYNERSYAFKIFMGRTGNYYVEVCEKKLDIEECEKCDMAMFEFVALIQEFRLKGVCNNPKTASDNVVKGMKTA